MTLRTSVRSASPPFSRVLLLTGLAASQLSEESYSVRYPMTGNRTELSTVQLAIAALFEVSKVPRDASTGSCSNTERHSNPEPGRSAVVLRRRHDRALLQQDLGCSLSLYPAMPISATFRAPTREASRSIRTEESACTHEWLPTHTRTTRSSWRPRPAPGSSPS